MCPVVAQDGAGKATQFCGIVMHQDGSKDIQFELDDSESGTNTGSELLWLLNWTYQALDAMNV